MADEPLEKSSKPTRLRSRLSRLLRWMPFVVCGYLLLWFGTTCFAPAAVNREFAKYYATEKNSNGDVIPAPFHTGVSFVGHGLDFWPNPIPDDKHWCCVGQPHVTAPFVVVADFAFVSGPLAAGAGHVVFVWTPWKLYALSERWYWVS